MTLFSNKKVTGYESVSKTMETNQFKAIIYFLYVKFKIELLWGMLATVKGLISSWFKLLDEEQILSKVKVLKVDYVFFSSIIVL